MSRGKSQFTSYVEEMALCVHPMDGHKKLFAMLQAYFDESGIDHETEFCILAGYAGGVGQWKRFERKWRHILKTYGVTEFHAKRFFKRDEKGHRLDQYVNWTDTKAEAFIRELLHCIIAVKIYPISCILVKAEWNTLTYGERRYLTGGIFDGDKFTTSGAASKAYFLPFQFCIFIACGMCERGQKVHFAFDLNRDFHGYSREYFKLLKNLLGLRWAPQLGQPSWPTSLEAVQLQAADLLAYLLMMFSPTRLADPKAIPDWMLRQAAQRRTMKTMLFLDRQGIELGRPRIASLERIIRGVMDVLMRQVQCGRCGLTTRHRGSMLDKIFEHQSVLSQDERHINYACPECNHLALSLVVPGGRVDPEVNLKKFPDDLTNWLVVLRCEKIGCESRVILLAPVKHEGGKEVALTEAMSQWRNHSARCANNHPPLYPLDSVTAWTLA
jgi:hypothetical protein